MERLHWPIILLAAILIGWTHAHTDEIPVVLGLVLLLSTILGLIFPQKPLLAGFLLGIPVFFVEFLVHLHIVHAPYPPASGIPWAALLGLVPALGGTGFGSAVRHLNQKSHPAR
jgi:hypothetical protein